MGWPPTRSLSRAIIKQSTSKGNYVNFRSPVTAASLLACRFWGGDGMGGLDGPARDE
jgi:hypothetical protein